MKKTVVLLAAFFTLSTAFVSCRDQKNATETEDVNIQEEGDIENAAEDVGDALDNAAKETGDAVEKAAQETGDAAKEGWNEVKENTGTGGTDDM